MNYVLKSISIIIYLESKPPLGSVFLDIYTSSNVDIKLHQQINRLRFKVLKIPILYSTCNNSLITKIKKASSLFKPDDILMTWRCTLLSLTPKRHPKIKVKTDGKQNPYSMSSALPQSDRADFFVWKSGVRTGFMFKKGRSAARLRCPAPPHPELYIKIILFYYLLNFIFTNQTPSNSIPEVRGQKNIEKYFIRLQSRRQEITNLEMH